MWRLSADRTRGKPNLHRCALGAERVPSSHGRAPAFGRLQLHGAEQWTHSIARRTAIFRPCTASSAHRCRRISRPTGMHGLPGSRLCQARLSLASRACLADQSSRAGHRATLSWTHRRKDTEHRALRLVLLHLLSELCLAEGKRAPTDGRSSRSDRNSGTEQW